jgi:hypothetical protein
LLLSLPLKLPFIGFFVKGLLFGSKHVGDELVAELFRIDLAFDGSFLRELSDL